MTFDSWRPFIAKFIAPIVGFVATYLFNKFKIQFSDVEQAQVVTSLVDLVVFAISTGVSAVGINKIVNPGNAASSHLAASEKVEADLIKDDQKQGFMMPSAGRRPNRSGSDPEHDRSGKL